MESIKKQIDAFLDSAAGQDQEKLKELLAVLVDSAVKTEKMIDRLGLTDLPAFEAKKAFINSKLADHKQSLKDSYGSIRLFNSLTKQNPDIIVMELVEQTEGQLLTKRDFGKKALNKFKAWVEKHGFKIGKDIHPAYKE